MLTDIFAKRYTTPLLWASDGMPAAMRVLLTQLAHLVMEDVLATLEDKEAFCHRIHDRLTRELGVLTLDDGMSYQQRCGRFLAAPYDLWNNSHQHPDSFLKTRLSLTELAFREAEERITRLELADKASGGLLSWARGRPPLAPITPPPQRRALDAAIVELNTRLLQARLQLHYHAGVIQQSDDDLATQQVAEPFWALVHGEEWENAELDMKEAIDRRDSGGRDAVLYAHKALESVIKIISDRKGWTRGSEKGPANVIDNLVSEKNGRFIEVWEGDILKNLFTVLRNLHAHGPGTAPMPALPVHQQTWAIDTTMTWIKSLVHRL